MEPVPDRATDALAAMLLELGVVTASQVSECRGPAGRTCSAEAVADFTAAAAMDPASESKFHAGLQEARQGLRAAEAAGS